MDLAAISAFVAVGDRGGFRAAADALGMTSSGVSKAVSRLEADLGVTLVARTTRSVRLTAGGEAFHARCKTILGSLADAEYEAAASATLPRGRLVISVSTVFGRFRVLPIIVDFMRQHPQVEVEARFSDRLVDLVTEGVDLAIRIGHLPDSGLIATRIGETGYFLCGSPEYLSVSGLPLHPNDLREHRVVGFVAPDTSVRFTLRFWIKETSTTVNVPSRLTVDDGEALVEAGVRSLGLVMATDYLVERHLADGRLVRVLRAFEMPRVPISVVHLPSRNPTPAARAFTSMLRRQLRSSL